MFRYTIRRLLAAVPVLVGILVVTFAMGRLVPGGPCRAILGERATPADCERFNHEKGLDRPIFIQFTDYVGDVAQGDLGDSLKFNRPVIDLIVERMPLTVELALSSLLLATAVGIPLGIWAATKRNSWIDVGVMLFANIGVSVPVFFLGLMLAYLFALVLKDTPFQLPPSGRLPAGMSIPAFYDVWNWEVESGTIRGRIVEFLSRMYIFNSLITGNWEGLKESIRYLILPTVALGTIPMSIIARMTRSSMLEVLGLDYIRTARAKGLTERAVILQHALRNALLPIVTIIGLQLGALLGGAVLTETIFSLTGVGRTLFEAITGRDFQVIQAFTLIIAMIFVLANLLVDLSYAFLDPRIRYD